MLSKLYKSAFFITAIYLGNIVQAQTIPNGGFETWSLVKGIIKPTGWMISDEVSKNCDRPTSQRSADEAAGVSALELTTADCGELDGITEGFAYISFPIDRKPDSLKFMYKLEQVGIDSAYVEVNIIKRYNDRSSLNIGRAVYKMYGNHNLYQAVSVPISYTQPDSIPNEAQIEIYSEGSVGNKLTIDEVMFANKFPTSVSGREARIKDIAIYPMPAHNIINIRYDMQAAGNVTIQAHDIQGKLIAQQHTYKNSGQVVSDIDISNFPPGVYLFTIQPEGGNKLTARFIKE